MLQRCYELRWGESLYVSDLADQVEVHAFRRSSCHDGSWLPSNAVVNGGPL